MTKVDKWSRYIKMIIITYVKSLGTASMFAIIQNHIDTIEADKSAWSVC